MKRSPSNIKRHELIGLEAEVSESTNLDHEGIRGEVIDETKKTINISGKIIPKEDCNFIFTLPEHKVKINGNIINSSPEERIKN
ncbi:MAG: RNase P/RNase MRP subunit p29 [Candidatus Methanohalarchaeum thermophilum]|uniref:Ribonuclease P protein component 1 n=1 Tax=Methanohalarchaeum thermophilum TaxID=1903181 RepID=A0A1Q6DX03_METT1|nr:MAG: RNase P/RNase MRP subunit p29 [Candidatus Methanohalarchaeum thermophilum]